MSEINKMQFCFYEFDKLDWSEMQKPIHALNVKRF